MTSDVFSGSMTDDESKGSVHMAVKDFPYDYQRDLMRHMLQKHPYLMSYVTAALEEECLDNHYAELYRVTRLAHAIGHPTRPNEIPCPLAAKIRKLSTEYPHLPNLIRMLVWTEFAEGNLSLPLYFEMYNDSFAAWCECKKPHNEFPEHEVLADYVQTHFALARKESLGTKVAYGLEIIHKYMWKGGMTALTGLDVAQFQKKMVNGVYTLQCTGLSADTLKDGAVFHLKNWIETSHKHYL